VVAVAAVRPVAGRTALETAAAAAAAAAAAVPVETAAVAAAAAVPVETVAVVAAAAAEAVVAVTTNTADSPGTLLPPPPSCTTPWAPSAR